MEQVPDWCGLLPELLPEIAGRLGCVEDFTAFRGVCSSWRASTGRDAFRSRVTETAGVPLLLLAEKEGSNEREFYSVAKGKIFMKVQLPEAKGRRCLEARFGWLLTMIDSGEVSLLNPISRAQIHVPNFKDFPNYRFVETNPNTAIIKRALLTSNPSVNPSNFVLMIIANYILGFWRPGDENWTSVGYFCPPLAFLGRPYFSNRRSSFANVAYYKDKFYAIDWRGILWVVDPYKIDDKQDEEEDYKQTKARILTTLDKEVVMCRTIYLVESSDGNLMIVTRDDETYDEINDGRGDIHFEVIRVDEISGEWDIISGLDEDAIFIGCNAAISVRVHANDAIKPNCIYFTDDYYEAYLGGPRRGGTNMGVYNIEDGTVERLSNVESYSFITPPLWVDSSIIFRD